MRTAQQMADAAAKRAVTRAANRAAGVSVRQQRAAAKAAKAGQPFATQPPVAPRAAPQSSTAWGTRTSRRRRRASSYVPPPPVAQTPVFAAPKANYRALKLAAMVAIEAAMIQKLEDAGGVAKLTDDTRNAFARYKKLKALALGACASIAAQTEADSALTRATLDLVKLAY